MIVASLFSFAVQNARAEFPIRGVPMTAQQQEKDDEEKTLTRAGEPVTEGAVRATAPTDREDS